MTLEELKRRYNNLINQNYETIFISQVLNDLRNVRSMGKPKEKKDWKENQDEQSR